MLDFIARELKALRFGIDLEICAIQGARHRHRHHITRQA